VHAIVQPWDGWELEELLGSIKKWTSRLIGMWLAGQPGEVGSETQPTKHNRARFWQQESYDRIIRDEEEVIAFRRYTARNPDVASLRPSEFVYTRAQWLDTFAPL
jgi:type I restriction enzyme R subunit